MDLDVGSKFDCHFSEAVILDDKGVDSAFLSQAKLLGGGFKFSREDESVHGEESLDPMFVKKVHELAKLISSEVVSSQAGVESGKPEVNGIGACRNGCAGAIPIAGRREEFGCEVELQGGSVVSNRRGGKAGRKREFSPKGNY